MFSCAGFKKEGRRLWITGLLCAISSPFSTLLGVKQPLTHRLSLTKSLGERRNGTGICRGHKASSISVWNQQTGTADGLVHITMFWAF